MSDKNIKGPDERLYVAGKDTTKDSQTSSAKNSQKPDDNRPKGEAIERQDEDDDDNE